MNEERLNEELDILEEIERVKEKRYQEFQQWLNQCPLVITDYSDCTNEFLTSRLHAHFSSQRFYMGTHILCETLPDYDTK